MKFSANQEGSAALIRASPITPSRIGYNPKRSWYIVGLLALLYAVSFMDRFMLALLIEPISREMGVSDAQMGLLLGGGFAAVYALGGLPLAFILDNNERRRILVAGVVLWSLSTLVSGFASNFATLALCRSGVALGEAVLTPAAISLIADLFPREKRGLPISIYAAVSSVMVTGSLVVNGGALALATALAPYHGVAPWRVALLFVGLPGLLLALLFYLTVKEPVRGGMDEHDVTRPAPPEHADTGFGHYLRRQWRFYLPYYCATGCLSMYSFAVVTWVPTLMVRRFGEEPAVTGYLLGAVGAPAALLGVFFWPWYATRLERRGHREGIMSAYLLAVIIVFPVMILMPLAAKTSLLLVGCFLAICCTSTAGCLTQLAVQSYGPNRMRARLVAVALLFMNLIGYTLGPLLVVLIGRLWPDDPASLGYGLSVLGGIAGVCAVGAIAMARWSVTRTSLLEESD